MVDSPRCAVWRNEASLAGDTGFMSPISSETRLLWQRSHDYARCAFAVSRDLHASGAEALFDHALNNGLAVIVSTAWPGAELDPPRRRGNTDTQPEPHVKSASGLLDVLIEKAGDLDASVTAPGVELPRDHVRVIRIERTPQADPQVVTLTVSMRPEGDPPFRPLFPLGGDQDDRNDIGEDIVRIDVATLREAITIAHPVRHGRARHGDLERRHIDALLTLDQHPHLGGLSDAQVDADYLRDKAHDLWLRDNAATYLELLGEDEIQRRIETADYYGAGLDGWPLQDCPVCVNDTLVPTGIDDFGIGIATGTCIVCSYWRSPREVDEEAQAARWKHVHQYE